MTLPNTLYNRLKTLKLGDRFIIGIGRIIHYDFSTDIKDLDLSIVNQIADEDGFELYKGPNFRLLRKLEIKYITLLEDYNTLLLILIGLANSNKFTMIKDEIDDFLVENEKSELEK